METKHSLKVKKIVDGDRRRIGNPQIMWLSEVGLAQFHAVHTYSRVFSF